MDIEDQVGVASVWVGNCGKRSGGTTRNKGFGRSVVVTRKEDHLCGGTGITDGGNGSLGIQGSTLSANDKGKTALPELFLPTS